MVMQAPGFFGKLPGHGDFVARRLPAPVRERVDRWLQEALLQSRTDLGDAWLATWLSSPLWRFALAPGVCGEQAWAGVMMPSHDRVGRCFPLLLAAPLAGMPSLRDCLTRHAGWFERLEELALSTLEAGFSLDAFDGALADTTAARPRGDITGSAPPSVPSAGAAAVARLSSQALPPLANSPMDGNTAWWTQGSAHVAPSLAICSGFPVPAVFASLLDGKWTERGWHIACSD